MEVWADINGFLGYQVSTQGRIRSFWKRNGRNWFLSNTPSIVRASDDGNGYMKVMLYDREHNIRKCKKIHRLVAEAFISNPNNYDTVDHIKSGIEAKRDNSVSNLRWMNRRDNIQKAYRDGVCDERIRRQKKCIVVIDTWTGDEEYFRSIGAAADAYSIDRSTISHILMGDIERFHRRYTVELVDPKEVFLHECGSYWEDY